ncbi:hypothetical protein ACFQO1_03420 [Jejudonia soesokkakensis]|uniref:VWFA domain-containing protein n=1 Tax=Jejudonia soesokkakensis TaxID=1323432 RepID=A0ABW2MQV8_9FLAO
MKNSFIYIIILTILACACKNDNDDKKELKKNTVQIDNIKDETNLNISILLDLSDRIDTIKYPNEAMQNYLRDIGYINSVITAFTTHLKQKKVRKMNDKIALYFDPEPKNQKINKISQELKFDITRQNVTLELFDEIQKAYTEKPKQIYELAISDGNYVGSDTWNFFKSKLKDYCIEDDHRNILIILTDGYMFHIDNKRKNDNKTSYLRPQDIRSWGLNDEKWESEFKQKGFGFIPASQNLQNLDVLVLGLNPDKKNTYEEEVLRKFWSNWLEDMDIRYSEIKTNDIPSNMDKVIQEFILQN